MRVIRKYLLIGLKKNVLVFETLDSVIKETSVNTNSLVEGCFLYKLNYFRRNKKDIIKIINKEIKNKKIDKAIVEEENFTFWVDFLFYLDIEEIDANNHTLSIEESDKLLKNRHLKKFQCYFLPQVLVKRFINRKIKVDLNYVDCINDIFMISNDIIDYDGLYFKKNIKIGYNNFSIKDFKEFININKYLKSIHLYYYNKEIINKIVGVLIEKELTKIVIIIHQSEKDSWIDNNFEFLRKINREFNEYLNGEIRISYSQRFIKNNFFKQLSYNNIKVSIIAILYVIATGIVFTTVYKYIAKYNDYLLDYTLMSTIGEKEKNDESTMSSTIPQVIIESEESKIQSQKSDKYSFDRIYSSLNKINNETIGWLTVNNTKINYPVVQHDDNEYYLTHDFYKKSSSTGWVYLDYRNEKTKNNDNIIIYGHRTSDGSRFGTLSKAIDSSWVKNKENLIIRFDSEEYNMEWEIFSVYTTSYTTDYLDTKFENKDEYNNFVDMLIKRSKYKFNNKPKYKTKILTLSTCTGYSSQNKRLVVHAKLISKEEV